MSNIFKFFIAEQSLKKEHIDQSIEMLGPVLERNMPTPL